MKWTAIVSSTCGTLLLLQGCAQTQSETVPLPALQRPGGQMAWQGELPCADCDAIDTRLLLQRAAEGGDYRMVETYRVGRRGVQFVEDGGWQRDGDLIRTSSEGGSRHVFALQPDGSLRPSAFDGDALPHREDARLRAVSLDPAQDKTP